MTMNVSISVQLNKQVGSEADFVRECQRHDRDCFANTLSLLSRVEELDLLALQEVEVADMRERVTASQPSLDSCFRGCTWDAPWNTVTHGMIFWNSHKLGKLVWHTTFDLEVGRPCLMILLRRGERTVLVISLLSFKLPTHHHAKQLLPKLRAHLPLHMPIRSVLLLGDFNDGIGTFFHHPISLYPSLPPLTTGLTRTEMQSRLLTCCWHEPNHPMGSSNRTSDYIFASHIDSLRIPPLFELTRGHAVASDHLPVEAWVTLP